MGRKASYPSWAEYTAPLIAGLVSYATFETSAPEAEVQGVGEVDKRSGHGALFAVKHSAFDLVDGGDL